MCYKEPESALRALNDLNNKDGFYVRRALKKSEREAELKKQTEKYKKSMQKLNLYVKNFPPETTEDELREFFSKFGEVQNVRIMRQKKAPSTGEASDEIKKEEEVGDSLGFGFISYTQTEAASRARLETKSITFKGVLLYVNQFETKAVR